LYTNDFYIDQGHLSISPLDDIFADEALKRHGFSDPPSKQYLRVSFIAASLAIRPRERSLSAINAARRGSTLRNAKSPLNPIG
jgi:hypothetical protein